MTISQVAQLFGVHEDTVRRWIHGGELPAVKNPITGRYKILAEDVESFRQKREKENAA